MTEPDTLEKIAREDTDLLRRLANNEDADEDIQALARAILKRGGVR